MGELGLPWVLKPSACCNPNRRVWDLCFEISNHSPGS